MNPKTIFLSAFFLFASALCMQAQDTYEYGAVTFTFGASGGPYLGVSTGGNYVETKAQPKFTAKANFSDLSLLLEKVNELAKEGWEVYSTSMATGSNVFGSMTYHLRRKKP